jgi:hypothetical protein
MIRSPKTTLLALALAAALPAAANQEAAKPAAAPQMTAEQKAMMEAYQKAGMPGAAHAQLQKMEGTYDVSIKSWEAPGQPPTVETGTVTRRMILDGRVLAESMQSKMHGQPFNGHGMSGYDNVSGKHWTTWNDSMSTGLMVAEGDCSNTGDCTFTGSWNDAVTKKKTMARMTTKWTSPTVEVFEMHAPGPDGKEMKMMEITYTKRGE